MSLGNNFQLCKPRSFYVTDLRLFCSSVNETGDAISRDECSLARAPHLTLTLNSSKTEFLLIGLEKQLSKIQDCSLATTHSAGNLGFIFDEHLLE